MIRTTRLGAVLVAVAVPLALLTSMPAQAADLTRRACGDAPEGSVRCLSEFRTPGASARKPGVAGLPLVNLASSRCWSTQAVRRCDHASARAGSASANACAARWVCRMAAAAAYSTRLGKPSRSGSASGAASASPAVQ